MLDDVESRPGSATSLVRTVVGAYVRQVGGAISAADLVALLGDVGVAGPSARSAVSRVKARGLLDAAPVAGRPGYRLAPGAARMLERGDRRIFTYRPQGETDPWCLVSYTVPETRRDARHQLRRHLAGIGCGHVATGLWICPGHLTGEVEEILTSLGLRDAATLFVTSTPRTPGPFADAAARWWDLERLAALHHGFLARHLDETDHDAIDYDAIDHVDAGTVPDGGAPPGVEAFVRWTRALDDWRLIPAVDPGLPLSALPRDWPGPASVATFSRLRALLEVPATRYVRSVVTGPEGGAAAGA